MLNAFSWVCVGNVNVDCGGYWNEMYCEIFKEKNAKFMDCKRFHSNSIVMIHDDKNHDTYKSFHSPY